MDRIPRVVHKQNLLSTSAAALFFSIFVLSKLPDDAFALSHNWTDFVKVSFNTGYFGLLAWMILRGVVAFETLEIDREEIRVYLGPVMIRRIPTNAICSVEQTPLYQNQKGNLAMNVVELHFESAAQRRERGERSMLTRSFWIEESVTVRQVLSRVLPRKVCNL